MKEFVIIAGTQNSGKTTTAWCVYQRLLPYSDATQMFIGGAQVENHVEIVYKIPPYDNLPDDFKAILHIYGYTVAIIRFMGQNAGYDVLSSPINSGMRDS